MLLKSQVVTEGWSGQEGFAESRQGRERVPTQMVTGFCPRMGGEQFGQGVFETIK